MSNNDQERIFILKSSEVERLIAHKQTEALKTIYGVAKEQPEAGWNELIIEAVKRLQKVDTASVQEAAPEEDEPETEPTLIEEAPDEEPEVIEPVTEWAEEPTPESLEEDEDPEEETEEVTDETGELTVKPFHNNNSTAVKQASIFDD